MSDRDNAPYIAAYKPCCGRMVFATGLDFGLSAQDKSEIADMIADGYRVVRMTAKEVRGSDWGCKCGETGSLFAARDTSTEGK